MREKSGVERDAGWWYTTLRDMMMEILLQVRFSRSHRKRKWRDAITGRQWMQRGNKGVRERKGGVGGARNTHKRTTTREIHA